MKAKISAAWRSMAPFLLALVLMLGQAFALDLLFPLPRTFGTSVLTLVLGALGFVLIVFLLSWTSILRWSLYGVWRLGLRPCLCDLPAYCHRHGSSQWEKDRPGVRQPLRPCLCSETVHHACPSHGRHWNVP